MLTPWPWAKSAATAADLAARSVQQLAVAAVPVEGLAARSVQQLAVAAVPVEAPATESEVHHEYLRCLNSNIHN
jgi:hypothetical protein